jgi:hypothetical protein
MRRIRAGAKWLAVGAGLAAAAYGSYVGITWYRYGDAPPPNPEEQDPLLDRFMPAYEVAERHQVRVAAAAAVTLAVAREVDLQASPVVRTIIRARELILGATPDSRPKPRGLLNEVQALGWGVLAENSRPRGHRWCCDKAVGGERHVPFAAARSICRIR